MVKSDFVNCLALSIMEHEGWSVETASYKNLNPGNLRFAGQQGATAGVQFAVFKDFYSGYNALLTDINAKLGAGLNSIRAILTKYSPPSENDTESYINNVVLFFKAFNLNITADQNIQEFLSSKQEQILIVTNDIWQPKDWHYTIQAIRETAVWLNNFGFSMRMVSNDLKANISSYQGNNFITKEGAQSVLQGYNEKQRFNILMFNCIEFNIPGIWWGGDAYAGCAISKDNLPSSFSSVAFGYLYDSNWVARIIYHEFIHMLFSMVGNQDTLHQYLIAHGGYNQNLLTDLQVIFNEEYALYKKGETIITLGNEIVSNPKKQNTFWMDKLIALIKSFFNQKVV